MTWEAFALACKAHWFYVDMYIEAPILTSCAVALCEALVNKGHSTRCCGPSNFVPVGAGAVAVDDGY